MYVFRFDQHLYTYIKDWNACFSHLPAYYFTVVELSYILDNSKRLQVAKKLRCPIGNSKIYTPVIQ
jgi:hypothetical protein